jgi:hypothetical protein
MKQTLLTTALLITTVLAFAQAPQGINYQAVVRDAGGNELENQAVSLRMTILENNTTTVYQETHSATTNDFGLVNLVIGQGTATQGVFADIDWSAGNYFAQTEVDVSGGTNYALMGSQQLMSVPYALFAESSGSVSGGGSGTFTHYIGEEFGGGVIFHLWLDANGVEHGLIVDKTDLSTAQAWSNVTGTAIGASAQSRWDGVGNSNAIVGQAGHTSSAAALCLNSTNGGYNDWHLPSRQELNMLWNNYYTVARSLSQIAGATELQTAGYWSSRESNDGTAWRFFFTNFSGASYFSKGWAYYVRAVRAF